MPPLDAKDPHVALGIEHGMQGLAEYVWEDAENDRRYQLGYAYGRQQAMGKILSWADFVRLMRELGHERQR